MFDGDADVMFYSESTLVIFAKVKDHFCGRLAILKWDSLALVCLEVDADVLKTPLFDLYIKKLP